MPSALPSRVPAGVPTGGRFAVSRHADPGTDLLEAADPAAERELFSRFSASARHWGNRLGVDVDDLLQDTAVEFYATLARQRSAEDPQPALNRAPRRQTRKECERVVMQNLLGSCVGRSSRAAAERERDPCWLEERPRLHALE